MAEQSQRLSKVAKEFNVGVDTILEFLASKGVDDLNRNSKISTDTYEVLVDEYQPDKKVKAEAKELKKAEVEQKTHEKEEVETLRVSIPKMEGLKIVSKVDIHEKKTTSKEEIKKEEEVVEAPVLTPEDTIEEKPVVSEDLEKKLEEEVKEPKEPVTTSEDDQATNNVEKNADESSVIRAKAKKLDGPVIVSSQKIDLTQFKKPKKKPVASSSAKIEGKSR